MSALGVELGSAREGKARNLDHHPSLPHTSQRDVFGIANGRCHHTDWIRWRTKRTSHAQSRACTTPNTLEQGAHCGIDGNECPLSQLESKPSREKINFRSMSVHLLIRTLVLGAVKRTTPHSETS